jgi:putative heme-binding domain-containing protein
VQDRSSQLDARRRALHSLLNQKNKGVSALLEQLLDEPELRLDAIRGYAAIENERAPEILLPRYVKWTSEHRQAIIETLATRRKYAESLLAAIKAKKIPIADIPSHVARSLSLILGDSFVKVYGDVRQLSVDRTKQINKYKELLSSTAFANADPSRGRLIFKETCAACHVLYGTGGRIGPDLTGSNRANLDYILLNSIDPSYDVPQGYKMVIIHTVDGRVLNGVIAEENAQRIILKTVQQPTVVILKSDIEARKISPKSMMPDGQLDKLKPQEVMNLIKYLQTTEQVELAQ